MAWKRLASQLRDATDQEAIRQTMSGSVAEARATAEEASMRAEQSQADYNDLSNELFPNLNPTKEELGNWGNVTAARARARTAANVWKRAAAAWDIAESSSTSEGQQT